MWLQQFYILALFPGMVKNEDFYGNRNVLTSAEGKNDNNVKVIYELKTTENRDNSTAFVTTGLAENEPNIEDFVEHVTPQTKIQRYFLYHHRISKRENTLEDFNESIIKTSIPNFTPEREYPANATKVVVKGNPAEIIKNSHLMHKTLHSYDNSQYDSGTPKPTPVRISSALRSSKPNILSSFQVASNASSEVGALVWQILWRQVPGCHFVLATADSRRTFPQQIISLSSLELQPLVVVDISIFAQENNNKNLLRSLWGDTKTTCRTLLIDLTSGGDKDIFSFLESSKLWLYSEAWIVIVGKGMNAESALKDRALRNTLRPLYLSLQEHQVSSLDDHPKSTSLMQNIRPFEQNIKFTHRNESKQTPLLYGLCRYCDNGSPGVRLLFAWWPTGKELPQDFDPFPNQLKNMGGHRIRAVGMPYFPFMDYVLDSNEPATSVTMYDCIDKRMLETFSAHLNFTYEVRAPWDLQFGVSTDSGNWTGLVGTIQYEKADVTTMIAPSPGRNMIFDHIRAYPVDPMAVVSPKPQVLPQYYLILRPFTMDVWLYLLLSIVVCGVALWLLQKGQSLISNNHSMSMNVAIFYSWSVIMQSPPDHPPSNTSGQMLLGWWLVACIVITTAYTSSLVAHLTVQSKSKPIDTWDDLVKQTNWKWGLEESLFRAAPLLYFKGSTDPNMVYIYKHLESISLDDAMKKILQGRYSFLCQTSRISMIIDSYYTDDYGRTPYYISKKGTPVTSDFGWGIRKGAPYREILLQLMNRLLEAGITDYWTRVVKTSRVKQNRKEARQNQQSDQNQGQQQFLVPIQEDDGGQTVLNMSHMTGVFLVLILGNFLAFLVFLGERFAYKYRGKQMHWPFTA